MNPIFSVFVQPRNKYYCSYIINNNTEQHTKTYDDIKVFLINLCPSQTVKITDMLSHFQPFILDVKNKTIIPLKFDYETEINKLKKNKLHITLKKVVKHKNKIKEKQDIQSILNRIAFKKNSKLNLKNKMDFFYKKFSFSKKKF